MEKIRIKSLGPKGIGVLCWMMAAIVTLLLPAIAQGQRQPNIVLFIADDLNQRDLGCYGNPDVKTPYVDQLAAEGMRFNKAYAASSMCAPSRSVIFTGLYPFRNGSQMNHFTVHAGTPNLPQFLQQQGYRVVISGKIDVFPPENFPFERIGAEFGKYAPIENRLDREKETVRMIGTHFKTRPEQPLCLIVAPWVPHVPWFPNRDFNPQELQLPDDLADTPPTRSALAAYYQSIGEADKMFGEVLEALDRAGKKENTVTLFTADQGAQFPGAKWTVYDRGLRVPFIVRWPGKVAKGAVSDALVSLVDLTPTLIDLAGGPAVSGLDGSSFKPLLLSQRDRHHEYVFAETSVEPHYWYNYTPARSIITKEGLHYIKNYHPGSRFITHIDSVERNEFYFDSWVVQARTNERTRFLLNRYRYRPPEELYDLHQDASEFNNLVLHPGSRKPLDTLRALLQKELARQGETDSMIISGNLPRFGDRSYRIDPYKSAADLSFNKKLWSPEVLYITAYLTHIDRGGVVCDYFNNFKFFAYQGRLGIQWGKHQVLQTGLLPETAGQLVLRLTATGHLEIRFNDRAVLVHQFAEDLTKIKGGYVTNGHLQGQEVWGRLQTYQGNIYDLCFTMNTLLRSP